MSVLTMNQSVCQTIRYIQERQMGFDPHSSVHLMRNKLDKARNLFRKDLHSHYGCVNAIEFSNEGDWLVSGGDDRRVLLWNVEKAIQNSEQPFSMKGEHNSNIFCLGFDNQNTKIFSAGNDEQVIVHDTRTGETLDVFNHEEAVYGISVDPLNSNVFASACDDGRVLIWDIREPSSTDPFCLASYSSAFHAVMYNPMEPRLLATANSKGGVSLWDVRYPRSWLMKYGGSVPVQSCMSVRFNRKGTRILALRRRLPPILFDVQSSTHVCQFDQIGYYNSCTMKSCCFAGDDDQFVLSGSDDFNLYMWRIPEESNKQEQWVDKAHMVLRGHRSIVNQVRFNPSNFLLASSGVEKIIKFWSPFTIPRATGGLSRSSQSADKKRKVYSHLEYINMVMHSGQVMTHDYSHKSTKEDSRMMAFFDSLVQREIEGLASDSSISSANSDSWLYNVAGTTILSDLASSSDGSSDDDGENRPTEGNGGRSGQLSPLTVAYANAIASHTSWNFDPDEDSTEVPDGRSSGTNGDDVSSRAIGADSDSQQSVTNTISWLIRQKRQQLLQAARAKCSRELESSERSPRRTSAERKSSSRVTSSRMSPTTSTSQSAASFSMSSSCSPVLSSSEATALEVSSSSASSSSSLTPSTAQSPPTSPSLDEEGTSERQLSRSTSRPRGLNIELSSGDGVDRRKVFRKRRARILQDLSDSDSGMDDDAPPRHKKFCTPLIRPEEDPNVSKPVEKKLENETDVIELPSVTTNVVINSKRIDASLSEEQGETSGSASTPDSGIVPQSSESKKVAHPKNETPELTSTRFKRIRMRGNGGQRQYRSRSNKECN